MSSIEQKMEIPFDEIMVERREDGTLHLKLRWAGHDLWSTWVPQLANGHTFTLQGVAGVLKGTFTL